jgi:4-hydroxy-tetrahydrodipicolinate synthase
MTTPTFGTVLTAMVTPFDADGNVDLDGARAVARFLCENGSDGLVVAGSTGEGPALSDTEKLDLFAAVAEAVAVPVIAGSTFANTAQSVALTKAASGTGVAGVLATTPAYSRPNQAGIYGHLSAVAEATPLPVMLYDIPSRTGRKIAAETTIALARSNKNVVALKDASADLVQATHVRESLGGSFDVYSGDDGLLLEFLAIGAVGIVSVAAHWAGVEFRQMVEAVTRGDWDSARALTERLSESCAFEGTEQYPNPMPSKVMMRLQGIEVGECRLPHGASDEILFEQARGVLQRLVESRG